MSRRAVFLFPLSRQTDMSNCRHAIQLNTHIGHDFSNHFFFSWVIWKLSISKWQKNKQTNNSIADAASDQNRKLKNLEEKTENFQKIKIKENFQSFRFELNFYGPSKNLWECGSFFASHSLRIPGEIAHDVRWNSYASIEKLWIFATKPHWKRKRWRMGGTDQELYFTNVIRMKNAENNQSLHVLSLELQTGGCSCYYHKVHKLIH